MANKTTQLQIVVDAQDRTGNALKSTQKQLGQLSVSVQGVSSAMKSVGVLGTAAFAGVTGFLGTAVKSYGETQLAIAKVDSTLKAMGKTMDGSKEKILEASKAAIRLGFDDEAVAVSITKLYQRTGDLNEAMRLNALAMDLSRAKSVDLETASRMIALVMSGNARALKEYGIELDETKTPMEALAQLQGMVAGNAEEATKSITVQTQVLREQFANFQDAIGAVLVPALSQFLSAVTPVIERVTEWAEKNPYLAQTVAVVALALTAVMAVMLPLGIALPGIVLAIQGLSAAFGFLAVAVGTTSLPLLGVIALLGIVAVTAFKVAAQWEDAWDIITITVASSANVVQAIVESMINFVIGGINSMIAKINSFLDAVSSIPGMGKAFKKLSIPEIEKVSFQRFDTGSIYNDMMDRPASRSAGEMIVNVTGNTFLDEMSAEKMGDLILGKLKMSNAI